MQIEDDDPTPAATGKIKGGPKKVKDVKETSAKKFGGPKIAGSGKGSGLKLKAGGGKKISARIPHDKVQAHPTVKKAENRFSLPKPSMPKKKGKR